MVALQVAESSAEIVAAFAPGLVPARSSYAPRQVPLEVAEGADLEGLELPLRRTEELTLEVRVLTGGLPRHVLVAALDATGQPALSRWFPVTDDDRRRGTGVERLGGRYR